MRITHIAAMAVIIAPLLLPQGVSQMSHEETVVRTTYARLAFAVQVNEVHQAIREAQKRGERDIDSAQLLRRLKSAEITFVLSDFKVGNVIDPDVGRLRYDELVTKPSGEALDVSAGFNTFETDEPKKTRSVIATARWQPAQTISEDWSRTWAEMLPKAEHAAWLRRYAAYKVKVTFAGQSREYHAMFVFGRTPSGGEYVVPVDTIVGLTGGLEFFATHDAYPEALVEGGIGNDMPSIRSWLRSQAVSGKKHSDNCDPETLTCGISQDDLNKIATPPISMNRAPILRRDGARVSVPRLKDASFRLPPLYPLLQSTTSCSSFTQTFPHVGSISDASRHLGDPATSNHTLDDIASTSCTYSDGTGSVCNTTCNVNVSSAGMLESGDVTGFCHKVDKTIKNDTQNGAGAGADCGGGTGGGVKECLGCLCSVTVSIVATGASVSITSDGFFTADDGLGQRCAAMTKPTPTPTPTPTPSGGGGGLPPDPCLNGTSVNLGGPTADFFNNDCSPIIVDTTGRGFHLTSAADGVLFDIAGTGNPVRIGWTAPGSGNAFLALPDSSGIVTNGTQLFGNFTPQPTSSRPNGFLALAVYDTPDHGGNNDGVIDEKDQVFSSLRLWIDENQDGICQPEELHKLPDLGVLSIDLTYSLSHRMDQFGNVFRYRADINSGISVKSSVDRKAFDVFFTVE